ncbi:MAG: MucR family transcriptional regulator [Magnetococcales bacterium]|nr:MucR family transcriptional regulator [Magnetococcales bacterium]
MMSSDLLKHTAGIVEAYVSNNEIHAKELPILLKEVFGTLLGLSAGGRVEAVQEENAFAITEEAPEEFIHSSQRVEKKKPVPFVPVEQAVSYDAVICLICGKGCRALKGHLTRSHKIDLEQYRKQYDLDKSFPMVAPAYSEKRRALAIEAGLGDKMRVPRNKGEIVAE